jgi:O-antigen/teichoic acid export membrane protein
MATPRSAAPLALALAETLGRGSGWLAVFLLPWFLSPSEFGVVALLVTFEGVATGFLLLGQDRAVMWRLSGNFERVGPGASVQDTLAAALAVTVLACVGGSLLVSGVGLARGGELLGVPIWPHLWLLVLAVSGINANRIYLAYSRVAGQTADFVRNRAGIGISRLLVTLGLAWATASSLAFPLGAAIGTLVGGGSRWIRCFLPEGSRSQVLESSRSLFSYGWPLSLHLLAMGVIGFVDRWVIGAWLGTEAVGGYSWFYMPGSAVIFLYAAAAVHFEPLIYRATASQRSSRPVLLRFVGICLAAAGAYALLGTLLAPLLSPRIPRGFEGYAGVAPIVLVAYWMHPLYLAGTYRLAARGRTISVAWISATTALLAGLLCIALVPILGALGGAWATLGGSVVLAGGAWVALRSDEERPLPGFLWPMVLAAALPALVVPTRIGMGVSASFVLIIGMSIYLLGQRQSRDNGDRA